MKKFLFLLLAIAFSFNAKSQITGTDTVCTAYIYTFDANIANADYFLWTFPVGWYVISGQGTSQVQLYCNQNIGDVCVGGYDSSGNFLAQFCNPVTWGGGGYGFNVVITPLTLCQCPPMNCMVHINGTGGPCAGCGFNGYASVTTAYAIYDGPWPLANLVTYAGVNSTIGPPPVMTTFYVYYVDTIFSQTNPIMISGGLCGGVVNNTFDLLPCLYTTLPMFQTPDPVCVGDTVTLYIDSIFVNQVGLNSFTWNANFGYITFQGPTNLDHIKAIKSSSQYNTDEVDVYAQDMNGCNWTGIAQIFTSNCSQNFITGDSVVCPGYTYSYAATIPGAVNYTWTFPVGWYDVTGQGNATATVTCNMNDGNICVEGFDSLGASLGIACLNTQFSLCSSASVVPNSYSNCNLDPFTATINFVSGTGNCPTGCGSGTLHPNIGYAVYDDIWPIGIFSGFADGTNSIIPSSGGFNFVYLVDYTNGTAPGLARLIEGGCGNCHFQNIITVTINPLVANITASKNPVCIGDTVTFFDSTFYNGTYIIQFDLSIVSTGTNYITAIVTGSNPVVNYSGFDVTSGCNVQGTFALTIGLCTSGCLVGSYPMDGNANDTSGNNLNGVPYNCTQTTNRNNVPNTAYQFNGTNSRIDLPSDFDFPERTWSLWFYADTITAGFHELFDDDHANIQYGQTEIFLHQSGGNDSIYMGISNQNNGISLPVNEKQWYHVAIVRALNYISLYFNGCLVQTSYDMTNVHSVAGDSTVSLGTGRFHNNDFFAGKIDDVLIYQCALSDSEISIISGVSCNYPVVAIASSDTVFCGKQSINFFDFSTNNPTSWQWTFTGAVPNSSTDQNPAGIYYPADGTFDVQLIACNVNGCDTLLLNNFITEFLAPAPPVITGNSGTIYCTTAITYSWYSTANPTTVLSTDSFYVPLQMGSYYVVVTDSNGCEATSNVLVITGLNDISNPEFNVQLINDFNSDLLQLIISQKQNADLKISVFDVAGKTLISKMVSKNLMDGVNNNYSIDVSGLAQGIYFISIETGNSKINKKFIVQ